MKRSVASCVMFRSNVDSKTHNGTFTVPTTEARWHPGSKIACNCRWSPSTLQLLLATSLLCVSWCRQGRRQPTTRCWSPLHTTSIAQRSGTTTSNTWIGNGKRWSRECSITVLLRICTILSYKTHEKSFVLLSFTSDTLLGMYIIVKDQVCKKKIMQHKQQTIQKGARTIQRRVMDWTQSINRLYAWNTLALYCQNRIRHSALPARTPQECRAHIFRVNGRTCPRNHPVLDVTPARGKRLGDLLVDDELRWDVLGQLITQDFMLVTGEINFSTCFSNTTPAQICQNS